MFLCTVAAVLKTVAFLPQALKVLKTKDASSISLNMYLLMSTGVGLWVIYGFHYKNLPVLISNAVILVLCLVILGIKLRFKESASV